MIAQIVQYRAMFDKQDFERRLMAWNMMSNNVDKPLSQGAADGFLHLRSQAPRHPGR
jgi:hypothetical protein